MFYLYHDLRYITYLHEFTSEGKKDVILLLVVVVVVVAVDDDGGVVVVVVVIVVTDSYEWSCLSLLQRSRSLWPLD